LRRLATQRVWLGEFNAETAYLSDSLAHDRDEDLDSFGILEAIVA
jgi:hypothetical protein